MKKATKVKMKKIAKKITDVPVRSDIYRLLKKDHAEVKALFKRIEKAADNDDIEEMEEAFKIVRQELLAHSKAEEQIFYKPLEEAPKLRSVIFESEEEHGIVERLLNKLDQKKTFDERWMGSFCVLKELILQHVKEEEGPVFKGAKKIFDSDEAKQMGEDFLSLKDQQLSDISREQGPNIYSSEEEQVGIIQ